MIIAIDIETIANEEMMDDLPEISAPENYKDEEKIRAYIEKKQVEQISKMAISPDYGKVFCVCARDDNGNHVFTGDEKVLLTSFWDYLSKVQITKIVTFNGKSFDVPYLLKRSLFNGVESSFCIPCNKYREDIHVDLYGVLNDYQLKRGDLDFYAKHVLKKPMEAGSGKNVAEWYANRETQKIIDHCLEDVQTTRELYFPMRNVYDI